MATGNTLLNDRTKIEASIKAFRAGALAKNAVNFFDALGYRSERTEDIEPNTAEGFLGLVNSPNFLNRAKARPEEWGSIDLLFQLTDEEVRDYGQTSLDFDSKRVDLNSDRMFESYLFFAVQLKKDNYNRTALADITREINRFFDMPALVLFKHGRTLTLSVINRRLHKRDAARDVLEKVTLIKDIRVENPHRAHVEILLDLAFPQLAARYEITSFVKLHDAWRETLDISELNKRFYKDLSNWYFWARELVKFPAPPGVTDEESRATNVIRLITRLTFVWFLKERGLVPDDLFRRETLEVVLTDLSPKSSTFYKAVLQNLFFATLNTPMSDPANPREFRKDTEEGKRFNDQYMVHNQYRHKKLFRNPDEALGMFASVPFLNGGLFECLDNREEVNGKLVETRVDGFSDVEKKQPVVPNRLFFCEEHSCADDSVDLNNVYGTRNKQYRVRGLIDTLNRYKFTIAENTPLDEEVALDPELLGKVFENLLASYNPETGATARKQTGSFYTPREIVNYMVDESLIAYLETRLAPAGDGAQPKAGVMRERDAQSSFIGQQPLMVPEAAATPVEGADGKSMNSRLRQLFAYTDEPHGFTDEEVGKLIRAIDEVKILDPACGSGAYPMGILGKLVFILSKLDPQNTRWKQRQIDRVREAMRAAEKIEDDKFRESTLQDLRAQIDSIEEAFRNNELDYGRKLFLIENCIYGVDIQPIAIQISKLRFFISLIIDQRIRAQAENLGIRPLPNLETKFVAANTLLGIEKPAQSMLQNEELRHAIEEKERELKSVRERHFTARTTRTKEKYRKEDERLRREIGKLLEADNWPPETTAKLIRWNPYDQNATADFFDPEWMFGLRDGFDIVIANPPYLSALEYAACYPHHDRAELNRQFQTARGAYDIFVLFYERGLNLLKKSGFLIFINPNKLLSARYAVALREFIINNATLTSLVDVSGIKVFSEAAVYPIMVSLKEGRQNKYEVDLKLPRVREMERFELNEFKSLKVENDKLKLLPENIWGFLLSDKLQLLTKILNGSKPLAELGDVNATSTAGEADSYGSFITDKKTDDCLKIINTGTIDKFASLWGFQPVTHGGNRLLKPYLPLRRAGVSARRKEMYSSPKIIFAKMARVCEAFLDYDGEYASINTNCFYKPKSGVDIRYIAGFCNSAMFMFLYEQLFGALRMSGGYFQFQAPQLRVIPIKKISTSSQAPIIKLVDQILAAKRKGPNADTSELEREIDRLLYQLYDLTPEEIEIVEASARR